MKLLMFPTGHRHALGTRYTQDVFRPSWCLQGKTKTDRGTPLDDCFEGARTPGVSASACLDHFDYFPSFFNLVPHKVCVWEENFGCPNRK